MRRKKVKFWINRTHDRFAITGQQVGCVIGRDMQGNPVKIPSDELQAWVEAGIAELTTDETQDNRHPLEKIFDRT